MISPFPYKVEILNPLKRIKMNDFSDQSFIEYLVKYNENPLVRHAKKHWIQRWLNYTYGPEAWDFEESEDREITDHETPYFYRVCFRKEEDAIMFSLRGVFNE